MLLYSVTLQNKMSKNDKFHYVMLGALESTFRHMNGEKQHICEIPFRSMGCDLECVSLAIGGMHCQCALVNTVCTITTSEMTVEQVLLLLSTI
jgi:hypothetical protein